MLYSINFSGDIETNPGPISDTSNTTANCISIAHLNIRSISNKIEFISDFMSDFDILCFSESHLDRTILDADLTFDTHESSIYRQDMTSHSGGLIAYVSNSLFSKRRYDLKHNLVHSM